MQADTLARLIDLKSRCRQRGANCDCGCGTALPARHQWQSSSIAASFRPKRAPSTHASSHRPPPKRPPNISATSSMQGSESTAPPAPKGQCPTPARVYLKSMSPFRPSSYCSRHQGTGGRLMPVPLRFRHRLDNPLAKQTRCETITMIHNGKRNSVDREKYRICNCTEPPNRVSKLVPSKQADSRQKHFCGIFRFGTAKPKMPPETLAARSHFHKKTRPNAEILYRCLNLSARARKRYNSRGSMR